jgi:hypothetical protein
VENRGLYIPDLRPGPVQKQFARGERVKSLDFAGYFSTHQRQADVTPTSRQAKVSEILSIWSSQSWGGR